RIAEVRVIQNIEGLGAELQIQSLTDSYSLQQRGVDRKQTRASQRTAAHVPESPLERQHEGSRIEPLIGFPDDDLPFKVRIPAGHIGLTSVAGTGNVRPGQRCDGESAHKPDAPIPLPAADQLVHSPSGAATEVLPVPKRQLIAGVPVELMGEAKG